MTTKEDAAGGTKARRYHTLDGMRGVAAIIVLLAHALRNTPNETSIRAALAVTMFFLLSGFVLGKAYDERLKAGMSLGQFTLARLIRLYPLWLLSLAIAVVGTSVTLLLGHGKMNLPQFVASAISALFFLPTPMPYDVGETMPLNPPGWSLFFELVANFIFGAFHARLTNRNLAILIVGCLMLLLIGNGFGGAHYWDFVWGFPSVGFSFFLGVLLQRFHRSPPITTRWAWLFPLALIPAMVGDFLQIEGQDFILMAVVLPALVYFAASFELPHPGPFELLGSSSYPIYVMHVPIFIWIIRLQSYRTGSTEISVAVALAFCASMFAIGVALDRLYDLPIRRYLTYRSSSSGKAKRSSISRAP
jgi:peptidoglycan/LPS O-acetylase OafA/YrhL